MVAPAIIDQSESIRSGKNFPNPQKIPSPGLQRAAIRCFSHGFARYKGDSDNGISGPLWTAYGNSYIRQLGADSFHIKYILANKNGPQGRPVKTSEIIRTVNKILAGDCPLNANRLLSDKRTQWHNHGEKRAFNVAFGDQHVEYFTFPASYTVADQWAVGDPTYWWW